MMIPMNASHRALVQSHGVMLGRMLMGFLFVFSGIGIITGGIENTKAFYESVGIPMAGLLVYAVIAIKIGAGGALMVGYRTGLAAGLLILFTLLATIVAHLSLDDTNLFKNLAIVGGLIYAIAYGPGHGWKI